MCQSDHMIGGFFCKLSRNPFLLDDIISALCDTQTRQESNSLCITSKGIMETKTNVLRVKYEIICTVKKYLVKCLQGTPWNQKLLIP